MKTRVLFDVEGIEEAVRLLAAGETVALPTETVYGLGADALDSRACAKIFEAKERPLYDPLIVHLPDGQWVEKLAHATVLSRRLAEAFWPGPLTMVLPRREIVPDLVTAGQDTVALRWSAHPIFQQVVYKFSRPIAAPSANRFGRISPTTAEHVLRELSGRIPLVLDAGPCVHGLESTIVLVEGERSLRILRPGPITAEQLGEFAEISLAPSDVAVPGGLKSHYAPRTPLVIGLPADFRERRGLLAWGAPMEGFERTEILSATQDLREAAANLYGAMRRLDEAGLDLIVAEPVPETGLGVAIMERLRKAAARE